MVKRAGVVGAGQMGSGIAQVMAQAGVDVVLLDASRDLAEAGLQTVVKSLDRFVNKEQISAVEKGSILGRIALSDDYADFSEVDLIVEAATENLQVKLKIFKYIDEAAKSTAIIASNTSSIPITRLAAGTERPEQVIGMHFMNPVPIMTLVEIIRAVQTSDETYTTIRSLSERMGKTVILSKDMPGFIVNRMLIPFLNEACFALQEGIGSVEDIDAGATLGLNHPLGPLALADLIGLDTVLFIAEVLHRDLGEDKYRPSPLLRNYVAAGWLGRKTGRGFYRYD